MRAGTSGPAALGGLVRALGCVGEKNGTGREGESEERHLPRSTGRAVRCSGGGAASAASSDAFGKEMTPGRAVPPPFDGVTLLLSAWSRLEAAVSCAGAEPRSSAASQPLAAFTSAGLEPLHFQNTIRQLQGTLLGNCTL